MAKKSATKSKKQDLQIRQKAPLRTPTDLAAAATRDISGAMNGILADVFALYMKTKNFHWHMSGPHFRDYHLLLDEQADQIYAMTDPIAERVRKLGGVTLRSIGHIARLQRVPDNDADYVEPSRSLDRRNGATNLVPVRGEPSGRRHRPLNPPGRAGSGVSSRDGFISSRCG